MRSQKSRDHGSGPLFGSRADRLKGLQLRFEAETVSRFRLNSSCAVFRQVAQRAQHSLRQCRRTGLAYALQTRTYAAACLGNLFVASARDALLEINQPRLHEHGMRVGIYKPRQNHAPIAIDLSDLLPILLEPWIAQSVFGCSYRDDLSPKTKDRCVLNDVEF